MTRPRRTSPTTRPFVPFELERWQSRWEHIVRFNLSESGVDPLLLTELLDLTGTHSRDLLDVQLGYSQTNGTEALRAAIAQQYPGATADNVLVTVGSAEANFLACWTLLAPGDHAAIQIPTYMQVWGMARNLGAEVSTFGLMPETGWDLPVDEFRSAVRSHTKVVVVTNPNNPTGQVLGQSARDAIIHTVEQVGSWLMVDEVYRGAERVGDTTPSFWQPGARTIVIGGLSKAYGLPGLRIGWMVAPTAIIEAAVQRHDYAVIGPAALSDFLAVRALRSNEDILRRTRKILRANYSVLEDWLGGWGDLFSWTPPVAGGVCFVRHHLPIDAQTLAERLRTHHDTLIVPGEHFHLPEFIRLGYGGDTTELRGALEAVGRCLGTLITD